VHDGDLAGRTPEVDETELHPEPESLPEADRLGLAGTALILTHGGFGVHTISTVLVNNTTRRRVTTVTEEVKRVYSAECVEGEFSEVRIQDRAFPQPPVTLDLHRVASIPSDPPQHLALQNKDTSQRIQTE
jgi:hypothetical protein